MDADGGAVVVRTGAVVSSVSTGTTVSILVVSCFSTGSSGPFSCGSVAGWSVI